MADGNGWRPEKGADKVNAHKGSKLIAAGLPNILQLHLKRFNYDWQTGVMSKLNDRFPFPDTLDLSSICAAKERAIENTYDSSTKNDAESFDDRIYDLQSVLIHAGQYGVGHYYAYVRPSVKSNTWYRFNDDVVEEVTFQDVIDDAYGGSSRKNKQSRNIFRRLARAFGGPADGKKGDGGYGYGGSTSSAYVVQYVKRCDIPMLYPDED